MPSGKRGSRQDTRDMTSNDFTGAQRPARVEVPLDDERVRRVLATVDTSGLGLEIGPSYNPLLPKRSGASIEIVDHASRDDLVAKYRAMGVAAEQVDRIEDVDYVSSGGSLVETIGRASVYDFIICSNVVEHIVDLIRFLQDCEALLKPNGRLSMSVPDQRYCFDLLRPTTSSGDVVDGHLNPSPFHTPGSLLESTTYSSSRDGHEAWGPGATGPLVLHVAGHLIPRLIDQWLHQTEYNDAHRWTFTPSSFSLLIQDLRELGYHTLIELDSEPPLGHEFFVTLGHGEPPFPHRDRLELMQRVRMELALAAEDDGLGPRAEQLQQDLVVAKSEIVALRAQLQGAPLALPADTGSAAVNRSEIEGLSAELARVRRQLDGMLSSRSWRLTAPLRRLGSVVRR